MRKLSHQHEAARALFPLPCACQSLRRLTRLVTRIYDQELKHADIEITQLGLLTALRLIGEANQKTLSAGFAMDSTTLTRTLGLLRKRGWISVRPGTDRRERLFRLTDAGHQQIARAHPHFQAAERRMRSTFGDAGWTQMQAVVARYTRAAAAA
jgi:DNA-binding MarR family transcriptional regulator